MNEFLLAFVIGSSYAVFLSFFIGAEKIVGKTYEYQTYTLIAPVYLGLMNVFGLYLAQIFKWSLNQRFFVTGLLSGVIVAVFATATQAYNFSRAEWIRYYVALITQHLLTFVIIVQFLTVAIN